MIGYHGAITRRDIEEMLPEEIASAREALDVAADVQAWHHQGGDG